MKNINGRSSFGLIILAFLMAACSYAPTIPTATFTPTATSAPATGDYFITGVAVVDVERGIAIPDQTVIIVGDRIDRIVASGQIAIPQGGQVIDGEGLYLMPGLVDAHVHFFEPPVFGRVMVANGVLLVRDMGLPTQDVLNLRKALNRGELPGPEMIVTGAILDGDPPLIPPISQGVGTPEQGRAAVREHAAAGVDQIKVYSTLSKEAFLAIIDEAQKVGLKVVGHVPEAIYIEEAAAAGLKSAEHFFGFEKVIAKLLGEPVKLTYVGMGADADNFLRLDEIDQQALQAVYRRLRESGLTVTPTVVTFKAGTQTSVFQSGDFPLKEYISPGVLELWNTLWAEQEDLPEFIWQNWAQMARGLNEAGVPLMVGTDLSVPGVIPGFSVHEEMALWQEAGIPAADVLRSATLIPAQFMGLGDRLGSIEEGKTASMLLVRANPLEDIRNAQQIKGIFLHGQYFTRQEIDRLLAEARELAQKANP